MSQVAHFSINANDVDRARRFYEKVFGWKFEAYGPPGFYMVAENSAKARVNLRGSLQKRREIVKDVPMHGFEGPISVDNMQSAKSYIGARDGQIRMPIGTTAVI